MLPPGLERTLIVALPFSSQDCTSLPLEEEEEKEEEEEEEEEEAPSEAFGYLNNELFRNLMFQG